MKKNIFLAVLFFCLVNSLAFGGTMDKVGRCENVEIINMTYLKGEYLPPLVDAINTFNKKNEDVRNFYIYFEEGKDGLLDILFSPIQNPSENDLNKTAQCKGSEIIKRLYINGKYANLLVSTMKAFNETNQDVRNFHVYIDYLNEEKDSIIDIAYSPKLTPGKYTLGGRGLYGKEIHYFVNIKTEKIVKTSYGK